MANERDVYEITNRAFDQLEARGCEINEFVADAIRATAWVIADLMEVTGQRLMGEDE